MRYRKKNNCKISQILVLTILTNDQSTLFTHSAFLQSYAWNFVAFDFKINWTHNILYLNDFVVLSSTKYQNVANSPACCASLTK